MSISLMTQAWRLEGVSATTKLVLLALADNANDEGACYPSIATLCHKCGLSERAIFHALRRLEQAGHLHREQRLGRSTLYHVHPCTIGTPALDAPTPAPDAPHHCMTCTPPLHDVHPTPAPDAPAPARRAPITITKPSIEPSVEPPPEPSEEPSGVATHSREPRPAPPKADDPAAKSSRVWDAYALAYHDRYGVEPVRNAKVNGQLAQLVKRLGAEAPAVAGHYVRSNNLWYVRQGHAVGCLLADAEKLRTEWATGQQITAAQARALDQHQTTVSLTERLIEKFRREGKLIEEPVHAS